jgi:hypothetical protein
MLKEYETDYVEVQYDPAHQIISSVWKAATAQLDDEKYKIEIRQFLEVFKKYAPVFGSLTDTSQFAFVIVPDLQDWTYQIFRPYAALKAAMIVSNELVPQLSVEQALDSFDQIETRYFSDVDKGLAWLLAVWEKRANNQENLQKTI